MKTGKRGWRNVTEADLVRYWEEMVSRAEAEAKGAGKPHLIFSLGRYRFAIAAHCCRGVVNMLEPTPLPLLPRHLLGVAVIRGRPISVTAIATLLGQEARGGNKGQHMVVIHEGDEETALCVERVISVRSIDPAALDALEGQWEASRPDMVLGSVEIDEEKVFVLDVARCLRAASK